MAPARRPANPSLAEDPLPPNAKSFFEVYLQRDTGRKKRVRFTLKRYNDYIRWIKTLPVASSPTYQAAQTARRYYTYYNGAGATLKEGLYRLSQKGKPELKVIHEGEMFDTIKEAHLFLNHAGIEPTAKFLAQDRYGITEDDVAEFQRLCKFCTQNESSHNKAPLHPIVTLRLFERVQIDLIDFAITHMGSTNTSSASRTAFQSTVSYTLCAPSPLRKWRRNLDGMSNDLYMLN
ncbi:hypothetical protein MPH_04138 [Macrophomina phaseolina MS6]|uniref:Uncharacterized protein n=1 Tax=Macrophomina phaseolina (strain MS6) TaxID=1126212 RepID=K2RV05_MACPH|nr:hypothetical protein MPH_04138 [Macrophomina phaseolina MS6]